MQDRICVVTCQRILLPVPSADLCVILDIGLIFRVAMLRRGRKCFQRGFVKIWAVQDQIDAISVRDPTEQVNFVHVNLIDFLDVVQLALDLSFDIDFLVSAFANLAWKFNGDL